MLRFADNLAYLHKMLTRVVPVSKGVCAHHLRCYASGLQLSTRIVGHCVCAVLIKTPQRLYQQLFQCVRIFRTVHIATESAAHTIVHNADRCTHACKFLQSGVGEACVWFCQATACPLKKAAPSAWHASASYRSCIHTSLLAAHTAMSDTVSCWGLCVGHTPS